MRRLHKLEMLLLGVIAWFLYPTVRRPATHDMDVCVDCSRGTICDRTTPYW